MSEIGQFARELADRCNTNQYSFEPWDAFRDGSPYSWRLAITINNIEYDCLVVCGGWDKSFPSIDYAYNKLAGITAASE